MRHNLCAVDFGYVLRPVRLDDAAFIVTLRSDPQRSRFVHAVSPSVADQAKWLRRYFDRPGDYYFIIESELNHRSEGTIGIYDVSPSHGTAEVGRWFLRPGSGAAHASSFLAWQLAFEALGLDTVLLRTVVANRKVRSFLRYYQSFGLQYHGLAAPRAHLPDGVADMVEYRLTRSAWLEHRQDLKARMERFTRMLVRSRHASG